MLGDSGLALHTGCVGCRVVTSLVGKLVSRGREYIQSDLILSRFGALILNLNLRRLSRSVHRLVLHHAGVEEVVELAALLQSGRGPSSPLLGRVCQQVILVMMVQHSVSAARAFILLVLALLSKFGLAVDSSL